MSAQSVPAATAAGAATSRAAIGSYWGLTPGFEFAVCIVLSVALALFWAFAAELDSPSSAAVTVLIVANPIQGAVFSKCLWRVIGTMIGAVMTLVLFALFAQSPWLFMGGFGLWLGCCAFAASFLRYFRAYAAVYISRVHARHSCITRL
jgi:uncharacterized membrane protein YccC